MRQRFAQTKLTQKHPVLMNQLELIIFAGADKNKGNEIYITMANQSPEASSSANTVERTKKIVSMIFEEEDIGFEEDILKNPFSLRSWLRYIEHKKKCKAPSKQINLVYERALKELPGSYKLWYNYLRFRRKQVVDKCPTDPAYKHVNNAYERALVFMHKMPRIWMEYCEFLTLQRLVTQTRRVFDRSLRALPVTQHDRIWPLYIKFVTSHEIPETTIRVYR
ncbi:unnamed protein product, partial [Onchocerca ochengi]|uniref:Suf domain-containing protein n=1 Tax=Onchocerca ochengi TaxID=42157 RepID=A0A182EE41_ONCOC